MGNAVGLLRNVHLGALQYASHIAEMLDSSNARHSSLQPVYEQLQDQSESGLRLGLLCMARVFLHSAAHSSSIAVLVSPNCCQS